jgi:hypothetical protein
VAVGTHRTPYARAGKIGEYAESYESFDGGSLRPATYEDLKQLDLTLGRVDYL